MLPVTADDVRLFLHLLAAAVWVGGQITLAALVPGLRRIDPAAPRAVARRFNRVAWPAFAVLIATGVWNLFEVQFSDTDDDYQVTVFVKLLAVALSGAGAALHTIARTRIALAVWGAVGAFGAMVAFFLGVVLAT